MCSRKDSMLLSAKACKMRPLHRYFQQRGAGMMAGVSGKALSCRWGGDEEKESRRRAASGDGSSSEEDEGKVSRAEELRRERLSGVVKRNLTGILLEVTDALFGAQKGAT